jgi:hypothetical protein
VAAEVRFAIAGGFAVVLHGVPRMTFDLDLCVDLTNDNMEKLCAALTREGYRPRVPVTLTSLADSTLRKEWVEERNMIAFSVYHPDRIMEEVDLLLAPGLPWEEVAASLEWRTLRQSRVPVVGRRVLRKMKLSAGREKDLLDAELLGEDDDASS